VFRRRGGGESLLLHKQGPPGRVPSSLSLGREPEHPAPHRHRPRHLPVSPDTQEQRQGGSGRGAGGKGQGCPRAGGDWLCPSPVQAPEPELGEQYEPVCDSTYSEAESAAAEVLDLPLPSYFRSRSHSYLRAIQAGCSQEEDTGSVRSISPPPAGSLSGSRTLPTNSSECQRRVARQRRGRGARSVGTGMLLPTA